MFTQNNLIIVTSSVKQCKVQIIYIYIYIVILLVFFTKKHKKIIIKNLNPASFSSSLTGDLSELICTVQKTNKVSALQMVAAANLCAGVFSGDQCLSINGMTRRRTSRRRRRRRSCMVCLLQAKTQAERGNNQKQKKEKLKSFQI